MATPMVILIFVLSIAFVIWGLYWIMSEANKFFREADALEVKAKAAKTKKELEDIYNKEFLPFRNKSFHRHTHERLNELNILIRTKYENMSSTVNNGYGVEYDIIKKYYGNQVAKRSQVPLINHIDEGIEILKSINANDDAIAAYCLHPILQSDVAVCNNIHMLDKYHNNRRIILTMEYRRVANNYLSKRKIKSLNDIELSPMDEVNQMLWADKIQNQKDFRLYHLGTHKRSDILEQYFINWINKLEPIIKK